MHTDDAIRNRCTEKVLSDTDLPTENHVAIVNELLSLAGMAPFHRACEDHHRIGGLTGIEPWRFYAMDAKDCRKLALRIPLENAGKIPAMLRAADALILATWLPNAGRHKAMGDEPGFELTLANVEHLAAASAAIQNLLLAATARGISNYWSSGGVLRLPIVLEQLGISTNELVLGAIFLFPKEIGSAERVTSKLREHRQPKEKWSRWIQVS